MQRWKEEQVLSKGNKILISSTAHLLTLFHLHYRKHKNNELWFYESQIISWQVAVTSRSLLFTILNKKMKMWFQNNYLTVCQYYVLRCIVLNLHNLISAVVGCNVFHSKPNRYTEGDHRSFCEPPLKILLRCYSNRLPKEVHHCLELQISLCLTTVRNIKDKYIIYQNIKQKLAIISLNIFLKNTAHIMTPTENVKFDVWPCPLKMKLLFPLCQVICSKPIRVVSTRRHWPLFQTL